MQKQHVLTLVMLATLGMATLSPVPIQAAAKTAKKATKVKPPKRYKIGKKSYTMKQMRNKYKLHYREVKVGTGYNSYNYYEGKVKYANSGTYNALTGKNHSKYWKSKTTKYYTFTSVYFTKKGKGGYWNYESHSIDAKTGHMYHFISIGAAGGK